MRVYFVFVKRDQRSGASERRERERRRRKAEKEEKDRETGEREQGYLIFPPIIIFFFHRVRPPHLIPSSFAHLLDFERPIKTIRKDLIDSRFFGA